MVGVLIVFEGMAWGLYSQREYVRNFLRNIGGLGGVGQLHLDSYEMADPEYLGHWRLRPNFVASSEALIAEKSGAGKWLGAAAIQSIRGDGGTNALMINSDGFKGPELDPSRRCPRILMIGDSVTFGIGGLSYPHQVRAVFSKNNIRAEVINAGVEGYGPQNVLNEMPRYLALKPEIVTIYIGWNPIFSTDVAVVGSSVPLKSLWLIRRAVDAIRELIDDNASNATRAYQQKIHPNHDSSEIKNIHNYHPGYINDITKIIDAFRTIDTEVYLITLMGLFQSDQTPSPAALAIGHLPIGTDNSFVLSALTDRTNELLRSISARDGVHLIDLQAWGRAQLQPPAQYFLDSVHFNASGLELVGAFLASRLAKTVKAREISCKAEG